MPSKRLRFTIGGMLIGTTVLSALLWLRTPRGFDSLSPEKKCEVIISRHNSNTPAKPDGLFEFHGPNVDTYRFKSRDDPASTRRQIENVKIPNYTVTRNWGLGNCGHSESRLLKNSKTSATLYLGITWVPIGKYSKVTFVWHNNGDDAR